MNPTRVRRTPCSLRSAGRTAGLLLCALAAGSFADIARADEPNKQIVVNASQVQTQRIIWKPHFGVVTPPAFAPRGPGSGCAQIVASVANQYNNVDVGGEITLQAGMVETEGFGSTYLVADPVASTPTVNEAFPIEVNLVEFVAGTAATVSGSNGASVRLGWTIEVWDGEPGVGTSTVVFSVDSDPDPTTSGLPGDLMLQRNSGTACSQLAVLTGGAPASVGKVQFSVDQTADAADRMLVPGNAVDGSGNPLNTFTVVVKILHHNVPGSSGCSTVDLCNNAFLATEGNTVNGSSNGSAPTYPTRNWLLAVPCGAGTAPGGYNRFSTLGSYRPTHDVLQQVTYTPAVCAGVPTGACCSAAGNCSITIAATCTGLNSYQGDSAVCNSSTCPTGACCAAAGTCSVTTQTGCAAANTFQGAATTCAVNPCPQPTGACCTSGACSVGTSATCSGTYQGTGTVCANVTCPQPTGGCCFGTGCLTATSGDCANAGGTYQGNGLACTGGCPTGACCVVSTGACSTATPAACTSLGGQYRGTSTVCSTTNCPPPTGACCAANNFCLSAQTQSDCVNAGLSWRGGGTVCSPNPCAPATGLCCRGTTCATGIAQASCTSPGTGIGASFTAAVNVCNAGGSNSSPCCYADFNKQNGVSVQDIFDYLNAWLAASPYCKINGNGSSTPVVQDIFDFLNSWLSGGCS